MGHNDDLEFVSGRLCNVRCWGQKDTRSCGGSAVILLQVVHWQIEEGCVSAQEGEEQS